MIKILNGQVSSALGVYHFEVMKREFKSGEIDRSMKIFKKQVTDDIKNIDGGFFLSFLFIVLK